MTCPTWCVVEHCRGLHSGAGGTQAWPAVEASASERPLGTTELTPMPVWWQVDDEAPAVAVRVRQRWSGVDGVTELAPEAADRLADLLVRQAGPHQTPEQLKADEAGDPISDNDGHGSFIVDRVVTVMVPGRGSLRTVDLVELWPYEAHRLARRLRRAATAAHSAVDGQTPTDGPGVPQARGERP